MQMTRRALFLDRDGVINVDHGYVHRPDQIAFVPGIFDLCRAAHRNGMLLIVVTNQAGIGRGYYSEDQFQALCTWMHQRFETENAPLAHIYHCPYHPEHGVGDYKLDSPDRKPNPGMILKAQKDFEINLLQSLIVGDRETDMQAGLRAGIPKRVLFDPNNEVNGASATKKVTSLGDIIPQLNT